MTPGVAGTSTPSERTSQGDVTVAGLLTRRSTKRFVDPGPDESQLDVILTAATTVPDHNELHPWRFVVVSGDDRAAFGAALEAAGVERDPDLEVARRDKLRDKAFVAPTFIVIVFSPKDGKAERWEQEASAAAAGYAMVLTAHLLGLGSIWKSAPVRSGERLVELLDMGADELLMGWVNVGMPAGPPRDRRDPVGPTDVASRLIDGRLVRWGQSPSGQG